MNTSRNRGFTMAELMVVVVVIGLLLAIAMPFFQRTYSVQRKITCINNLEKLGQAYHTRDARGALQGVDSAFPVMLWPQMLSTYLSGSTEAFICPEDQKKYSAAQGAKEQLKQIYIEVFDSDAHNSNYSYKLWDVPLDEEYASEWCWRLSEEQFQAFLATPGHGVNYKYGGYKPGADPSVYWFTFEDQGYHGGGDKDYYDLMFKIQVTDTKMVITPQPGVAGYSFNLCQGQGKDKKMLIKDVERNLGAINIEGAFGACSYGMNSMAPEMTTAAKKLLILDYEKSVARGSDYDSDPDEWLSDPKLFPTKTVGDDVIPKFFRHLDKANVLFGDGTVRSYGFDDVTIYDDKAREKYWNPKSR